MITLTGVLEDDPQPHAGGVTTMTLAAKGELFTVSVSSRHAQWLVSMVSGGALVQVQGELAAPDVIHALWVWPVVEAED